METPQVESFVSANNSLFLRFSDKFNSAEWTLVELQGELKHSSKSFNNGLFCRFGFLPNGSPAMMVRNLFVLGDLVELRKPVAILQKVDLSTQTSQSTRKRIHPDNLPDTCKGFEIVGIAHKKIVFKNRPQPYL